METESNLDKARRRYPPGTSYVVLYGSGRDVGGEISKSESKHFEYDDGDIDCGIGFVYADGIWAPRIFDIPEHGAVEIHGDIYDDVLYMLQQTPRHHTDGKHSSKYYKYLAWNDTSYWHCTHTSKPIIDSPFAPSITPSFSLFHNPDSLTQEQVGEGYRLLYPSEIKTRDDIYKSINGWDTDELWDTDERYEGSCGNSTYRVPACFPKDFSEDYIREYEAGTPVRAKTLHEDLIEEAKRRYPVGTEYRCANRGSDVYTVTEQRFTINIRSDDVLQVYGERNKGCLYHNYRWADIVKQAKPKFKIGDKVIGNDKASKLYNITRKGYISEVVSINEDNSLVKLTSGFYVSTECFDLYTEEKTEVKEQVNKLINPINNSENEKHTENRSDRNDNAKSAILQSIDFKIGQGSASRGVGLKGSVSEIRLGNHSGNYQERLSHS